MWWVAHAGWDGVTSWDPDFIYVPLVGAALLRLPGPDQLGLGVFPWFPLSWHMHLQKSR